MQDGRDDREDGRGEAAERDRDVVDALRLERIEDRAAR